MCEIYAYSGEVNKTFNDELREFFSHSGEHPNGWGLAVEENGRINLEKEAVQASESHYLRERLRQHLEGTAALAHIRYATIGSVKHANCHPFMGKDRSGRWWTLVHNGTIFDYAPMDHYTRVQTGSTDSERILLYLIDIMNAAAEEKGRILTARERFELLDSVFALMSRSNKLNLILYDGKLLYVHSNSPDSLFVRQGEKQVTFSTQPLTKGRWKPAPFTQLAAWRKGEKAFEGAVHGNVYVPDEKAISLLYLAYSQL